MTWSEQHVQNLCKIIETLRAELDAKKQELREANRLSLQWLNERDEARRIVCNAAPDPMVEAATRGWLSCFDTFDTRGLHGDPKEPKPCRQVLVQNSWVDEGSHA